MAVLRIARMGNPVLSQIATPVEDPTAPEIRKLAADMQETLEDIGASGLAAPQVFVGKRVVVYRVIASRIPAVGRVCVSDNRLMRTGGSFGSCGAGV